jgi:heat shock protein 1/8
MDNNRVSKSDIDDVVLVGGSTRIPKVQQLLSDFFDGKELCKTINPDEAVASGAAIQAGVLSGDTAEKLTDVIVTDVTPFTLGLETAGGVMTPLISKNAVLPAKFTQVFSTHTDNQPGVTLKIFEGERALCCDNNLLGRFQLSLPPAPRGEPCIEVTFEIDVDGILNVSAEDQASGVNSEITIASDKARMTQKDVERMIESANVHAAADSETRATISARHALEAYAVSNLSAVDAASAASAKEAVAWLAKNAKADRAALESRLRDLETLCCAAIASAEAAANAPVEAVNPEIEDLD